MKIGHRAFFDVERALAGPVSASWRKLFKPVGEALAAAAKKRDWVSVDNLIDTVNAEELVKHGQLAATVAIAAYFLGVSRVRELGDEDLTPTLDRIVGNAITQWGHIMMRDMPARVRKTLHIGFAKIEHTLTRGRVQKAPEDEQEQEEEWSEIEDSDVDAEAWQKISDLIAQASDLGSNMAGFSSSLVTSRMSNYGALSELYSAGVEKYMISAILDDKTCEVCEALDGQIFNTADGVAQATAVMDAEDPESLKSIAPWPKQDKASVAAIQDADAQDLVDQGLQLPPYHGFCRCIAVDVDDEEAAAGASGDEVMEEADADVPDVSTAVLARLLGFTTHPSHGYGGLGLLLDVSVKHKGAELEAAVDEGAEHYADHEHHDKQLKPKPKKPEQGDV